MSSHIHGEGDHMPQGGKLLNDDDESDT